MRLNGSAELTLGTPPIRRTHRLGGQCTHARARVATLPVPQFVDGLTEVALYAAGRAGNDLCAAERVGPCGTGIRVIADDVANRSTLPFLLSSPTLCNSTARDGSGKMQLSVSRRACPTLFRTGTAAIPTQRRASPTAKPHFSPAGGVANSVFCSRSRKTSGGNGETPEVLRLRLRLVRNAG